MADVFLGSVYAKLELRDGDLGASVNAAKRSLNGLDGSMAASAAAGEASGAKIGAAFGAVAGVVQSLTTKAFDALTASIGGGIRRFDTLQNYPKIMQNLGYSAEESSKSIQKMSENAKGLPVSLDALASSTKQLAPFTKNLTEATDLSSALSDAFLAAGSSVADTNRGMTQYTQMLAKGKVDMGAWNTLQETMGSSLQQVSKKLLGATGTTQGLYSKLQEGEISFHDFNQAILSLDKEGLPGLKNFRDQAFDATGGIQTTLDNLGAAFNRFWENLIKDVGSENIRTFFSQLGKSAESMGKTIGSAIKFVMPYVQSFMQFMIDNAPIVEKVILGLVAALVGFKVVKGVVGILKPVAGIFGSLGKAATAAAPIAKAGASIGSGVGGFIANSLKPLGDPKVLMGAASVAVIGVALIAMAFAFNQIAGMKVDIAKLGIMALAVPIAAGIFALVGTFGVYAAIGGIATAIIGGGLAAVSAGMSYASNEAKNIDFGSLMKLTGIIVLVSGILAGVSAWATFAAIGAVASAVIGGGLLVASMGLAKASLFVGQIDIGKIVKFSGMLGIVSVILGTLAGFSIFGAVGSIATMVISGGLLVSSLALMAVSKNVDSIKEDNIDRLLGIIAKTTLVLAALSGLSVFAAIGSVVTSVISGGVALAAIQLAIAAEYARRLKPEDLDKLGDMLKKISEWDTGGVFKNLSNMVSSTVMAATARMVRDVSHTLSTIVPVDDKAIDSIKKNMKNFSELETGGVMKSLGNMLSTDMLGKTATNIKDIITTLSGLKSLDNSVIDSLKKNITTLSELETGGVMKSLGDMWASGNLQKVAENIKKIVNDLTGLKAPDNGVINALKTAITNLSKIEIQGNGLFQNKGADAEQLAGIVSKIREMADKLSGFPSIDYGKVLGFVNSIKVFDRIDDNARNGVRRLNELGDSLSNINWIKSILGNVPEGIWENTLRLVNSIKLFDRIDDNARNGAMRLATMKDSLGNIDWVKKILGDVPADLPVKAQSLVDAINKLGGINVDTGRLRGLGLDLVNNLINGIKTGIGSIGDVGRSLQGAFWNAIQAKMSDEFYQGVAMANQFINGLRSKNGDIASVGRNMQGALWNAIQGKMQDEYWQGAAMAGKFVEGLKSKNGEFYGVGSNAVQGFINGANSKNPYSTGWNIASRFLQGLKDKGKEGSPWKTTFQSGAWAGEGFANGILRSEDGVVRAASTIADAVMDTMNLDNMGNMMVTPNMTELNSSVRSLSSSIDLKDVDRANEVAIYGNISINSSATNGASLLDDLARATILSDKGMATAV